MSTRLYSLEDGRTLEVCIEVGMWSAWLQEEPQSHVIGYPLEAILMEVIGLEPAHDEVPSGIARLADHIRTEFPSENSWLRKSSI